MQLIWSCRSRRLAFPPPWGSTNGTNRSLFVVAVGVALSFGSVRESHAEPRVATRLIWESSVCGSAADFAARVGKRTNVARFVQRGQRLVVRARIERRGDGLAASASIEARGGTPVVRRLESADCNDALDALALVVAIGIEGRSSPSRARRRSPPAEPPPPLETVPDVDEAPPPEPPASPPEPTPAEPAPAEPARPEPPPVAASERVAPQPPPAARRAPAAPELDSDLPAAPLPLDIGAGLSAAMSLGVAPAPVFGGALWISVGWARHSVWAPELVVSAQHQRLDDLARVNGRADFALSFGSVSLCPLRLGNGAFELRPCAVAGLGRLDVAGHSTFDARSSQRPWRVVGGTLEGVARVGAVEFRAVLGATAPLARDSFQFEGPCADGSVCEADVFHQVAPVIWSGALGVGIRIW